MSPGINKFRPTRVLNEGEEGRERGERGEGKGKGRGEGKEKARERRNEEKEAMEEQAKKARKERREEGRKEKKYGIAIKRNRRNEHRLFQRQRFQHVCEEDERSLDGFWELA